MVALRLYPLVPQNARMATEDTVLPRGGGPDGKAPVFVKKGQTVAYQVYSMQRRKDLYGPTSDDFDPSRWETIRPGWEVLHLVGPNIQPC